MTPNEPELILVDFLPPDSLSSVQMLADELLKVAPVLGPHVDAAEKALTYVLNNYHLVQDHSSSQTLFTEAAEIFFSSANISSDDVLSMMSGRFSGLGGGSFADMLREAIALVLSMNVFGDDPMVYGMLEHVLASNATNVLMGKVTEMFGWLASTQASGLDLLTQALPKMHEILRCLLSLLTQDDPADMKLFEDIAGNAVAMLRHLLSTADHLGPASHHTSQQQTTGGNRTVNMRRRREVPTMTAREPVDDFIDLFLIDYPSMFRALAVPPAADDVMETVHVFVSNPDLNVVVKGATRHMPWALNASREEAIDAALGVFSFLTLPNAVQM